MSEPVCKPPIFIVISFAALVSTAASMGGGLVMYFESIASLEETIRQTSRGEVASLEDELKDVLVQTQETAEVVRAFMYNTEGVVSSDPEVLLNQSRALSFSQLRSLGAFALGYVLVPYAPDDNTALYHLCWMEELTKSGGGVEIMHGRYHHKLEPNADHFKVNTSASPPLTYLGIRTNRINTTTGELGEVMYTWNGMSYINDMLPPQYDPRSGEVPGELWNPGLGFAVAHKWRPTTSWRASDGTVYAYSGYDGVYAPPAAPHPWSHYRAVIIISQFTYVKWAEAMAEYKQGNPDRTVIVFGRVSGIVYASTTGHKLIDDACNTGVKNFSVSSLLSCATRVDTIPSLAFQDAYNAMKDAPYYDFRQLELNGKEYFVRRGGEIHQDTVLIWLRPKSSVAGKVNEALVVLIVFTVLVLAFDILVAALELIYIAQPIRRLSVAIQYVGELETEAAAATLSSEGNQVVVVREMYSLVRGMQCAITRLEECRTFMPETLRPVDVAEEIVSELESPVSTSSSHAPSRDRNAMSLLLEQTGQLSLYLVTKMVGLLYVNAVGWWKPDATPEQTLTACTEMAAFVLGFANKRTGVLDTFSGDRFLIGWNTARTACEPAMGAANAAIDIIAARSSRYEFSCSVTSGAAKVGNVGTAQVRRFAVLSPLVPWLTVMEAFCKAGRYRCVTDEITSNRLSRNTQFRVIDAITPMHKQAVPILQLLERSNEHAQEWMYELNKLEENDNSTELSATNAIALAVIHKQWDVAEQMMLALRNKGNLADMWVEAICAHVFRPQQLRFCLADSAVSEKG